MRLIDADAMKKAIADAFYNLREIAYIADIIERQPTIDPEVRHGRWFSLDGWFNKSIVKCSVCGNTLNMDGVNAGRGDANFCPNCGARMDGGAENASA